MLSSFRDLRHCCLENLNRFFTISLILGPGTDTIDLSNVNVKCNNLLYFKHGNWQIPYNVYNLPLSSDINFLKVIFK